MMTDLMPLDFFNEQIKKYMTGGAYSTHKQDEKGNNSFSQKT
jgi:hypothetical protein